MSRTPTLAELSESTRALVADLQQVGLTEGEAITVTLDGVSQQALQRVRVARQWNGLSESDARRERSAIAAAAKQRRETPVVESELDARSASVFGRPVQGV